MLWAVAATRAAAAVTPTESSGVLLRSFAIALVVMAPVALWQWWRVRDRRNRERAGAERTTADLVALSETGAATGSAGGSPGEPGSHDRQSLEALVAEVGDVARRLRSGETTVVEVPPGLTVGGRPSDPRVVEAVLRDAIERSGLELVSTGTDQGTLVLGCRRR